MLGIPLVVICFTLAAGFLPLGMIEFVQNMQQREITTDRLEQLRRAVNGNPAIVVDEARTSFGYIGDMGNLPTDLGACRELAHSKQESTTYESSPVCKLLILGCRLLIPDRLLEDLWVKGSQPAFAFDTTKKTGAGWNGPYLEMDITAHASTFGFDAWGAAFDYSPVAFVDSDLGADALGKLASLGPDMVAGGDDDVTVHFFESSTVSRVQGFIRDGEGDAVPGTNVTVNFPQNGSLTSQTDNADDLGYYSFTDIPFGNRTLTIEPRLVLAPGTAIADGNNVEFTIKNFSSNDVAITSIQVEYTIAPPAYFKTLKVGGNTVYDSDSPRFGDGDSVAFSSETIDGTGEDAGDTVPIAVQSPVTQVADLIIGDGGGGGARC